ncbi:hypothetical protein KAR91_59735 [Candidatus Pacearchaeota archaeon]|nr:hypothetical protein [Candidatus Pacearchaeota archaeon]
MTDKSITFKWGTIKGWEGLNEKDIVFFNKYFEDGQSFSCMNDRPNEARKAILCDLIDSFDGTFFNDWDGENMTKEEAKKYIMEYDKRKKQ